MLVEYVSGILGLLYSILQVQFTYLAEIASLRAINSNILSGSARNESVVDRKVRDSKLACGLHLQCKRTIFKKNAYSSCIISSKQIIISAIMQYTPSPDRFHMLLKIHVSMTAVG